MRAFSIWRNQFLWLGATYFASASIAAILVAFTNTLNWALVGLLLPLIAASFVAVRTTLGRLEDANQHLAEVNRLYLSTIETLAMAVDAKDQVTHGHIRRVQRFAVELAKELVFRTTSNSKRSKQPPCFMTWESWLFPSSFSISQAS